MPFNEKTIQPLKRKQKNNKGGKDGLYADKDLSVKEEKRKRVGRKSFVFLSIFPTSLSRFTLLRSTRKVFFESLNSIDSINLTLLLKLKTKCAVICSNQFKH